MYNYACDVDLYWGWANVVVNNRFVDHYARRYHICYVARKHSKNYVHSHEEIMDAFGYCILYADPVPEIWSLAMGNFYYLVRTADRDEMLAAAHFIQELA
jgi:hypothetical protein